MEYVELTCESESPGEYVDIVIARLAEIGYEAFEETENGVKAYVQQRLFQEDYRSHFTDLEERGIRLKFSHQLIPFQNWNSVWESNFEPVVISDQVYIRAEFHPERQEFPYEIIIQPRMAFGTGHHATTSLMMENMMSINWQGKSVLDMGCGTGILSILACKLGAANIVAIDHDDIAVINTVDNAAFNHCLNISALCGDATALNGDQFDIILANINRNIILEDLHQYTNSMKSKALILLSGFYIDDCDAIIRSSKKEGLNLIKVNEKNKWACMVLQSPK